MQVSGERRIDPTTLPPARPRGIPVPRALARPITLWFSKLRPGVPALLLAVATETGGCYCSHERPDDAGTIDAGRPDAGPFRFDAGPPFDAGERPWCDFGILGDLTVELPPEGVPAEPALICAEPGMMVDSGFAARVSLARTASPSIVQGTITLDADLAATVMEVPVVRLIEDRFGDGMLGPVTFDGADYVFTLSFPFAYFADSARFEGFERFVFETEMVVTCGPGDTRRVVATTIVHPCHEDDGTITFASSGEECKTCAIIAEMAPTPLIPVERPDSLPLQQGIQLRLRPIARFENALVLWAEHDQPNRALIYDWYASRGELLEVSDDVRVWLFDGAPEPQIAQVAVRTDNGAAVASYRLGIETMRFTIMAEGEA